MARCTKGEALCVLAAFALLVVLVQCGSRRPPESTPQLPATPLRAEPAPAAPELAQSSPPPRASEGTPSTEEGIASWYGPGFDGKETANGERYDQDALTAAHPTLPFGTRVRVTLLATGRNVVVRINDRGPDFDPRIIDLSRAAGRALGLIRPGTGQVRLEVLE